MIQPTWILTITLAIASFAGGRWYEIEFPWSSPTVEQMARHIEATDTCMQYASRVGCQVSIENFVLYYDYKERLKIVQAP